MRLVKAPLDHPPRACAVTNREDGELIDMQVIIDRPLPTWLYLKREIVEDAARLCGMVPEREVEELREGMKALGAELEDLRDTMNLYADFEEKIGRKEPVPA